MPKTIIPFTAQLVTFNTTLPIAEVISRLDVETNKVGTTGLPSLLSGATSREALEEGVQKMAEGHDFVYFHIFSYMLKFYQENAPNIIIYTIGHPLIASTVMQYDVRSAYNIPLRLLIIEKSDGNGTEIVYHLPSSVIVLIDNPLLKAELEAVDEKLDRLLAKATSTSTV